MQCHFDAEAVVQSDALTLNGLPDRLVGGEVYELEVKLAVAGMGAAGMLLSALDEAGAGAGAFAPADEVRVETKAAQARSTPKAADPDGGEISWRMSWTAPDEIAGPIRFYLSANAANDDESPFGDMIHFRTVER